MSDRNPGSVMVNVGSASAGSNGVVDCGIDVNDGVPNSSLDKL